MTRDEAIRQLRLIEKRPPLEAGANFVDALEILGLIKFDEPKREVDPVSVNALANAINSTWPSGWPVRAALDSYQFSLVERWSEAAIADLRERGFDITRRK